MAEPTLAQIKAAARKALAAGDMVAARKLIARGRTMEAVANVGAQPGLGVAEGLAEGVSAQVPPGRTEAALRSGLQGLSFGFGDEGASAVAAGLEGLLGDGSVIAAPQSFGDAYSGALDRERGALQAGEEAYPWATMGAEVAGAMAAPAAAVGRGAGLLGNMARGASVGALEGAAYGFGKGEGGAANRGRSAAEMGLLGAVIGGAVPAVARAFRRSVPDAPAVADLRQIADDLYKRADAAAPMPRAPMVQMAQDTADELTRRGLDPDLTPQSNTVLSRVIDAATDPNPEIGFRELDILRRKAQVPAGNFGNPSEQALGSEVIERIDDLVDTMAPTLGETAKEARAMWARMRKSDMIVKAMAKAQNAASGYENGLRIEFRRILNNPKLSRGLKAEERKALEAVVNGTKVGNFFRQIGKMGIGLGNQSNGLGAMVGSLTGGALLGPAGQVLFPAIGTGAKAITNSARTAAAERALAMIASGGQPIMAPAGGAMIEAAMRRAALSGGQPLAPGLLGMALQAGQ
jgi:hypothetical protein